MQSKTYETLNFCMFSQKQERMLWWGLYSILKNINVLNPKQSVCFSKLILVGNFLRRSIGSMLAALQISAAWAGTEECALAIFEQTPLAIFHTHNMRPEQTAFRCRQREGNSTTFALTVDPCAAVRVCVYTNVFCVFVCIMRIRIYGGDRWVVQNYQPRHSCNTDWGHSELDPSRAGRSLALLGVCSCIWALRISYIIE